MQLDTRGCTYSRIKYYSNSIILTVIVVMALIFVEWTWLANVVNNRHHIVPDHSKISIVAQQSYLIINQQNVKERSYDTSTEQETLSLQQQEVRNVLNNIKKCMKSSNLHDEHLIAIAKQNAEHVLRKYRKVIPMEHLTDYNSHCWNTNYSVTLISNNDQSRVRGHIGKIAFDIKLPKLWYANKIHKELKTHYSGRFSSSKVCLPNLYLLGFGKCGSTFLWCVMSKVLNHALGDYEVQIEKEPFFWTQVHKSTLPDVQELGGLYAPMFLRAVDPKHNSDLHKKVTLIDGCPRTIMGRPKLRTEDPAQANHCLFPSVLPQLFPDSKYLVIMRNPVDLLYSAFWWTVSANTLIYPFTDELGKSVYHNHLKGPEVFHKKVVKVIEEFIDCINHNCFEDNQHKCTLFSKNPNFSSCITQCTQWLTKCVATVTTTGRTIADAGIYRGIYYIHVLKWVQVLPKNRIHFIKLEGLSSDIYSTVKHTYEFIHNGEQLPLSKKAIQSISLSCKENTNRVNYKSNPALWMRNNTRHILEEFFQPFNKMLSDLLEDKQFLWNDN